MKKLKSQEKINKLETQLKLCMADFDNFRKRVETDKKDWELTAKTGLIVELLPILDNFDLALSHLTEDQKKDPAIAGIFHIQSQLINVMSNLGVEKIATATGDTFDPNIHEAIDSHEGKGGDVIHSVHYTGYKHGDKVLRPTKVTVTKKSK